jgi:hypothetical protein
LYVVTWWLRDEKQDGELLKRILRLLPAKVALLFTFAMTAVSLTNAYSQIDVTLIDHGEADCVVRAVPELFEEQHEYLARYLIDMLEQSTGAKIQLLPPGEPSSDTVIQLGLSTADSLLANELKGHSRGSHVVKIGEERIVLAGLDAWGTERAVYTFLEQYVGVSWLNPGELWEEVPSKITITAPAVTLFVRPPFHPWVVTAIREGQYRQWTRCLGQDHLNGELYYNHNLHRLFPVEELADNNPEVYPVHGLKTVLPEPGQRTGWQPRFIEPETVDIAVKAVKRELASPPYHPSVSLSVNDGGGFSDGLREQRIIRGRRNRFGYLDHSDIYYHWADRATAGVLADTSDILFGSLAYREVADPPRYGPIHPAIVPYLCFERTNWLTVEGSEFDKKWTGEWLVSANEIGWYDYIYGAHYLLPVYDGRARSHAMRFAAENGIRGIHQDIHPSLGNGPRVWMAMKLVQFPFADPDSLLNEWCDAAVGEAAADSMVAYFRFWESVWAKRILPSTWSSKRDVYLRFVDPSYLAAVDQAVYERASQLLDHALGQTSTKRQQSRALVLREFLNFSRANWQLYQQDVEAKTKEELRDWLDSLRVSGVIHPKMSDELYSRILTSFPGQP